MNNNKINFVRINKIILTKFVGIYLHLLSHSNIYMYILFLFIYIVYNIYTCPILLCDDGENLRILTQLKFDLSYEISRYRTHNISYEYLVDIKKIGEDVPMENRNLEDERYLAGQIRGKLSDMNGSLNNVRKIESEIRKLDPNFQSPMRAIYYPRVGK